MKMLRIAGAAVFLIAILVTILTGAAWALLAFSLVLAGALALLVLLVGVASVMVLVFAPASAALAVLLNPRFETLSIRVRRLSSRRDVRRWIAFGGGVVAVLVPTLLTLFPAWGLHWKLSTKVAVVAGWLLTAGLVVLGTIRTSEMLEKLGTDEGLLLTEGARKVEWLLVKAVLSPENTSLGPAYAPQLFVPDRFTKLPDAVLLLQRLAVRRFRRKA